MTDIGELEEYVEAHPAEDEQRWRLAKKLYKACEYPRALEHLQLLADEWQRKLNVLRYLAATHYRLGQHDDAIRVLERAVQSWPQEIGAREQLARVLEASGRREEAASVWESVLKLEPRHPLAHQSVKRLHRQPDSSASGELGLIESDSGIDLTSGWTCSHCGAKNNDEFERCWQCHAPGSGVRAPTPKPAPRLPRRNPWVSTLVIGLLLVAALCWGLFLFLSHLAAVAPGNERLLTDTSVRGLFAERFFLGRAVTALVFLLAAPQILRALLALFRTPPVPRANVTLTGLLLATSLYVALWAPPHWLLYALLAPAALLGAVLFSLFRIGFKKSLLVWASQLALSAAILFGCLVLSLRVSSGALPSIGEAAALARLVQTHDAQSASSRRIVQNARCPASIPFAWQSTGSTWLDALASDALFEITSVPPGALLNVKLLENGAIVFSDETQSGFFRLHWSVTPGRPYELRITGQEGTDIRVAAYSVLPSLPSGS